MQHRIFRLNSFKSVDYYVYLKKPTVSVDSFIYCHKYSYCVYCHNLQLLSFFWREGDGICTETCYLWKQQLFSFRYVTPERWKSLLSVCNKFSFIVAGSMPLLCNILVSIKILFEQEASSLLSKNKLSMKSKFLFFNTGLCPCSSISWSP